MEHYIPILRKEASKSPMEQHLSAIIVKDGKIVARGFNRYGMDSSTATKKQIQDRFVNTHAEMDCLFQTKLNALDGAFMFVARFNKIGELQNSCPCGKCQKVLFKFLDKIYYIESGKIKKLEKMEGGV